MGDDDLREGVRRIGRIVDEQVALYGTLTGKPADGGREREPSDRAASMPEGMADVLHLPRRRAEERRAGGFE